MRVVGVVGERLAALESGLLVESARWLERGIRPGLEAQSPVAALAGNREDVADDGRAHAATPHRLGDVHRLELCVLAVELAESEDPEQIAVGACAEARDVGCSERVEVERVHVTDRGDLVREREVPLQQRSDVRHAGVLDREDDVHGPTLRAVLCAAAGIDPGRPGSVRHAGGVEHLDTAALEAGLTDVRASPRDDGRVELIVRRPASDEREILDEATLDPTVGLVGDTWQQRGSSKTEDGSAHPDMQLTLMNARAAALVAGDTDRRALAGDQMYVDLDLSGENLPPGSRLEIGSAVVEVTDKPHTGCAKFKARFGHDALRFVNSPVGRELNLRGINSKVVTGGVVRPGDAIRKIEG